MRASWGLRAKASVDWLLIEVTILDSSLLQEQDMNSYLLDVTNMHSLACLMLRRGMCAIVSPSGQIMHSGCI